MVCCGTGQGLLAVRVGNGKQGGSRVAQRRARGCQPARLITNGDLTLASWPACFPDSTAPSALPAGDCSVLASARAAHHSPPSCRNAFSELLLTHEHSDVAPQTPVALRTLDCEELSSLTACWLRPISHPGTSRRKYCVLRGQRSDRNAIYERFLLSAVRE